MTFKQLKQLKTIVTEDLKMTTDNASDKSLNVPYLYHKYQDVFIDELQLLKTRKQDRVLLYNKMYREIKDGNKFYDTKNEVETVIFSDDKYDETCRLENESGVIVEYLKGTLENISKISFNVKNFIEYRKFLEGN